MLSAVKPPENHVEKEPRTHFQIAEIFSSIQGEGAHGGEYNTFIRFNACNLDCFFCDTQDVMKNGKYKLTPDELIREVAHTTNVVFTGGEPTLPKYQKEMVEMLDIILSDTNINRITTETNGVHIMQWYDTLHSRYPSIKKTYSWSPKYYDEITYQNTLIYLHTIKNRYRPVTNSNIICKIVLDEDKIEEFEMICSKWLKVFPKNTLYIMAMGDTVEKLEDSTQKALEYQQLFGCSFSPRLHIELGLK